MYIYHIFAQSMYDILQGENNWFGLGRQREREDSGGVQDAPGATTVRRPKKLKKPTGRCVVRGAKQTIYNIIIYIYILHTQWDEKS
jgi:hypothetical protein